MINLANDKITTQIIHMPHHDIRWLKDVIIIIVVVVVVVIIIIIITLPVTINKTATMSL